MIFLAGIFTVNAQKDTIKDSEKISRIVKETGITQKQKLLSPVRADVCNCISKIETSGKTPAQIAKEISQCIDDKVDAYQIISQSAQILENTKGKAEIKIFPKGSGGYQKYYYEIEENVFDSCEVIKKVVAVTNQESENSISGDPTAVKLYNKGIKEYEAGNYAKAISYFKDALQVDSLFAFAWDNIGICNRKLGNLDEALAAYQQSLKINPFGLMPLQNIPIVYLFQKNYDIAIEEYKRLAAIYPNDPETYYGIGNVLIKYKNDYENGLKYMCKAYSKYIELHSPYRVDAQKQINFVYSKMKAMGKESLFYEILKENNINPE